MGRVGNAFLNSFAQTLPGHDATASAITTQQPLFAFQDLGLRWEELFFIAENTGAVDVWLIIEFSERGALPDINSEIIRIPPGYQATFAVRDVNVRYWRMSAHSDPDASFPAGEITRTILGVSRSPKRV